MQEEYKTVDEYIRSFPPETQVILEKMRQVIRRAAPEAVEGISYRMPAYKQNGVLVYFAAFKKHIGFFPTAAGIEAFKTELSAYTTSKGTVQFPLNKPVPYDLVEKIVEFKVQQNLAKRGK
jgi:uncharacterized protein YdhG (YjbR/CyaY superfamily)